MQQIFNNKNPLLLAISLCLSLVSVMKFGVCKCIYWKWVRWKISKHCVYCISPSCTTQPYTSAS